MPRDWVFVTGCDSGFGEMVVKDLGKKGFGVFATHLLPESAEKLKAAHTSIEPILCDITKQESVDAAVERVKKSLEGAGGGAQLYGLINNAGLLYRAGPLEWTPASNFEKMLQVNVVGAVRVTNGLLPFLRKSRGRIVNVASMVGQIATPTQVAYSTSKFAMEGYSDGLRREVFDWGITVHIIEPGIFKTTGLYDTYRDGVQKLWDDLPVNVKGDYGEEYKDGITLRANKGLSDFGSTDKGLVPKAMMRALTDRNPKYRYRVGMDCKILVNLCKWFHESWQDEIFRHDPNGRVVAKTCDPNAYKSAENRYGKGGLKKFFFMAMVLYFLLKIRRSL